jgi:RNA polymerase sigma factor (sigma-70 family)
MAKDQSTVPAGFARRTTTSGGAGDPTDGQLLERFTARHDEAAFAALVQRHGPMVLGVCQRVLRNPHDAEDAFQATFLVLVRKARTLRRPESLGNWLYGVAYRTAAHARTEAAKRRACERQVAEMPVETTPEVVWRDLRPVLDGEVNRLPDKYRVPFVLCYLEGKTNEEAARCLGCPGGTIASRLARARERLRARLARRGLALSAGLFATVLPQEAVSARLPAALADSTSKAARLFAADEAAAAGAVSDNVAALTKGVLKAMLLTKLRTAAVVMLLASAVAGGVALLGYRARAVEQAQAKDPGRSKEGDKEKLQGTWYAVSVESHGQKAPMGRILAKGVHLVIDGDKWTLKEVRGDPDKAHTARLDPTKRPKQIDITYDAGENKGRTSLGIYERDGNTLRVCLGEPGDPRPTKFDGGGTYTLEVFKREKPKPAPEVADQPL